MTEYTGNFTNTHGKIAIVVAKFNKIVTKIWFAVLKKHFINSESKTMKLMSSGYQEHLK